MLTLKRAETWKVERIVNNLSLTEEWKNYLLSDGTNRSFKKDARSLMLAASCKNAASGISL